MSGQCPRCGPVGPDHCAKCHLDHEHVDVLRWLWLLRDTKPKPPGAGLGILAMLAARMDAKTGCGWVTDPDLAELAGYVDRHAVQRATRWGRNRLLLHRESKGYRVTNQRAEKSLWFLTDPATQRNSHAPMASEPTEQPRAHGSTGPTEQPRAHGSTGPTEHLRRPNGTSEPDPTEPQCAAIANPEEKLIQEANPIVVRTNDPAGPLGKPGADRRGSAVAGHGGGTGQIDDDSETRSSRPKPGPGYGSCPECGDWQVVKCIGGTLARHHSSVSGHWSRCPGSKQPPAEPVPCTGCGRTGLALTAIEGLCTACRADRKAGTP